MHLGTRPGPQALHLGRTLPALLRHAAELRGSQVAIREKDLGIWQEISWRDYHDHVRNFALGLLELGLTSGDRVAIQAENCQEWLYTDLAVQCAGGIVVTVYPTSSTDEVRHIVEDSKARVFIAGDQEQMDKALALRAAGTRIDQIIVFDTRGLQSLRSQGAISFKDVEARGQQRHLSEPGLFHDLVQRITPDDIYDIMYTSGTSGQPKGAICTQAGAVEGARAMLRNLPITAVDSWLSYLPLSHAFERIMAIPVHLLTGYVINFAGSIDTVQADLAEIQPTIFGAVPRIIEKIKTGIEIRMGKATRLKRWVYGWGMAVAFRVARERAQSAADFRPVPQGVVISFDSHVRPRRRALPWHLWPVYSLAYVCLLRPLRKHVGLLNTRALICGAAPIAPEVLDYFIALGVGTTNAFGMTELHNIPTLAPPEHYVAGTVGYLVHGWSVRKDEEGQLCFKGPFGFRGYYGAAAADAPLSDGWLRTGDLGEVYENGYVSITGRMKDVIITSGGKNVSPEFIENKLKASLYISEAIVIGDGRKYLSALIELDEAAVGDFLQKIGVAHTTLRDMTANVRVRKLISDEIESVNQQLSRVETIKQFAIIPKDLSHDDGEMTPTRKVKRAMIEKRFAHLIDAMYCEDLPDAGRKTNVA